ncbi:hypothetical protein [Sorangium sp. So ce363]|uniref:hypothetical protein n=1 Tax=Sorangium sp. So ce363 TaxID=3133304 RepID=UPI003F625534
MALALATTLAVAGCCDMRDDDGPGGGSTSGGGDGGSAASGEGGSSSSGEGGSSSSGEGGSSSSGEGGSSSSGEGGSSSSGEGGSSSSGEGGSDRCSPVATHNGIISIQDVSIQGLPQAGHGLTVQVLFTSSTPPAYEQTPGKIDGCRAWVYDVEDSPPPALTDQGVITIAGLEGGPIACRFAGSGYVCPTSTGAGQASVAPGQPGTAAYTIEGATFSAADVGRYLRVTGAANARNQGAFPIVAVESSTTAIVVNQGAAEEAFAAEYTVLAGAGPVPNNPVDPIERGAEVVVGVSPGGEMAFDFPDTAPIPAGQAFTPDTASAAALVAVPLDGSALTLGCGGPGGSCGSAQATVVRITSTDGNVEGASPAAMPPPARKQVEIQCVAFGGDGTLTIPAEAMKLLQEAHQVSPISRIRTALMREGWANATNAAPLPPNTASILVGHGLLGFTNP